MGRLKKYSEALPASPEMDAFVADVYLGVGELAVDSQRYYLRPPYGRSAPHVILKGRCSQLLQSDFGRQFGAHQSST